MATREAPLILHATATIPASKFGEFKPVVGSTGTILYTLKTEANHSNSMKLLDEAGLRPLTRQEILPLLMKDETLKNSLKGKWFYLAGEGLKEDGIYTINSKGDLVTLGGEKVSVQNRVRAFKGPHLLSLVVISDRGSPQYGGRFGLAANCGFSVRAPVVVGVPKLEPKPSQAEPASPVGSMLRLDKDQVLELTFPGGVTTTLNVVSAKVLGRKRGAKF